ncbi:MAG TPA: hypothetical protein VKB13_01025 [Gaiellaceae bacterium]|nr:hypothetical protein [Gaiellaceae bacterium]
MQPAACARGAVCRESHVLCATVKCAALATDIGCVRLFGYIVAGWFLIWTLSTSLVLAGGAGPVVAPLVAVGVIALLVHTYRRGGRAGRFDEVERLLDARLTEFERALPADPLENAQLVAAWTLHGDDRDTNSQLAETYREMREKVAAARSELELLRSTGTAADYARLQRDVAEIHEYLRAISVLSTEAPELLDRALAAHADALRAVDAKRETTEDATALELLEHADATLKGARAALVRGDERPLDALLLTMEARRLADSVP